MAFSQFGYLFILHQARQYRKEYIQQELARNNVEDELTVIDFTTNEKKIYWEEEGKEFSFKGEMYDVVKTKIINGKKYLYCINDEVELKLINKYNSETEKNNSKDKKVKTTIENIFSPYVLAHTDFETAKAKLPKKYFVITSQIQYGIATSDLKPPQNL